MPLTRDGSFDHRQRSNVERFDRRHRIPPWSLALRQRGAQVPIAQGPVAVHLSALLSATDAVLVDPPRKGLDGPVRQALIEQPVQ
ncbi:MAG: hypothetical protein ACO4BZ_09535, partial [Ilumatobacteraceae bacterium]